jgi:hypothetical protein
VFTVSALYKRLLTNPKSGKEIKLNIAGVEYGPSRISACSISGGMFQDFSVGECAAKEIDVTLKPQSPVPRMAQISVFYRLVLGQETSEWVPGGVFFVDTRREDKTTGWIAFHGYDAMLKAETTWWDPSEDAGEWPMTMNAAVSNIAARMGVAVDTRTTINAAYRVEYPNDLTMREVLMNIAVAHGGNWRMTGEGKLLLVPMGGLPGETNFLVDSKDGGAILMGDIRIIL